MVIKRIIAGLPLFAIMWCGWDALATCHGSMCGAGPATHALAPMGWTAVLPLVIWIGCGAYGGIVQYVRTRRALRPLLAHPRQPLPHPIRSLVHDVGLWSHLDLVQCTVPDAFCYGLLKPRVVLTTGLLDLLTLPEIEAVLRHEHRHLVRRDPLRALGWTILDHACWWMAAGSTNARIQRELAADRAVIAVCGQQALAGAIYKLVTQPRPQRRSAHPLAVSYLGVTDARIDQLLNTDGAFTPTASIGQRLCLPAFTLVAAIMCVVVMVVV